MVRDEFIQFTFRLAGEIQAPSVVFDRRVKKFRESFAANIISRVCSHMLRQYGIYALVCLVAMLMAAGVPPFPALKKFLLTQFTHAEAPVREKDGQLPDGAPVRITTAVEGWVDKVDTVGGYVVIQGWAADKAKLQPANRILVFRDGVKVGEADVRDERPDVSGRFNSQAMLYSGFRISVPVEALPVGRQTLVAIMAETASGLFGELKYNIQFPFRHSDP
ncbi:hypothetical protein [Ferrovibrio sp.]|uniref:hypothetical protein n=1 Tax=Ferrovibrio sp. TaxID=1917215 RepID=UPI0035B4C72B